jgi:hypothetical protein
MDFRPVLSLFFGVIVTTQPSAFSRAWGIDSRYSGFVIILGALLLITAMVVPV